jgi:protein SCO1/2
MMTSNLMRIIRYIAWGLVALTLFVTAALFLGWWRVDGPGARQADGGVAIPGARQIGGPFTLVDHRGRTVTERDFAGRPKLVFFGFTHCPDVCPTTLTEISARFAKIGPAADRVQVLFITADPERDTPELMALYLQSFDPRIVGLSGTREQIDAVMKAYGAVGKRVETSGGYNVDHTASVYMIGADGRFLGLIDHHEAEEMAIAKIRRLLGS